MMMTLPSVEIACSMLQQEEMQKEVLRSVKEEPETLAMYSKSNEAPVCTACGKAGHVKEKCWTTIGYPSNHPDIKVIQREKEEVEQAIEEVDLEGGTRVADLVEEVLDNLLGMQAAKVKQTATQEAVVILP